MGFRARIIKNVYTNSEFVKTHTELKKIQILYKSVEIIMFCSVQPPLHFSCISVLYLALKFHLNLYRTPVYYLHAKAYSAEKQERHCPNKNCKNRREL